MTKPIAIYKQIQDFARPFVEPLFLQDFFFRTGRSATTTTATGIFVQRKGQLYCITCRHVVEEATSPTINPEVRAGVLTLALDAGALLLGTARQSCFASPTPGFQQQPVDVALARIPWGDWDTLKGNRNQLSYIDFDNFKDPDYTTFVTCAGVGFPDKRKVERDGRIKVGLAAAVAPLTRAISVDDAVFQLHAELEQPHGVGLSGMSGGLVAGIAGPDEFTPIGIVFQGGPSGEQDGDGTIAGPRDVFLRCYRLTANVLDEWLERTVFPDITPMFMAVVM